MTSKKRQTKLNELPKARTKARAKAANTSKTASAALPDETPDLSANGLSDAHNLFISHYLTNGLNQTRAAIDAGYSPKSAHQQAHWLMNNPKIRAEIDRRLAAFHMSGDEIIARLASQGRGDMSDFINDAGEIDLEQARERGVLHRIKRITQETAPGGLVRTKIELYDVQGALVKLGHAAGKLVENVRVAGVKTLAEALGADDPNDPLEPFE